MSAFDLSPLAEGSLFFISRISQLKMKRNKKIILCALCASAVNKILK